MGKVQRLIILTALIGVAGCATKSDLQSLEYTTDNAKKRIARLEQEMAGVRQTASEEVQGSLQQFRQEMNGFRKSAADLQASQDTIRVDMREMSGRIDDIKILMQKSSDDKGFLKEETERRLAALENRLAKLEERLGNVQAGVSPNDATPEGIYERGISAYKAGEMQKARDLFSGIIEQHPSHKLVPNCQYWIGETYYGEKKFEQAILAFQDVIKKYPKDDKAPAALLKQALSFKSIGDKKSARYVLNKLADDYPKSEEAKNVKGLIKAL